MKKIAVVLAAAVATLAAPALAADLRAKAPMRAAPVAFAPSWTGCYIGAGGGYGMYSAESREIAPLTGVAVANQGTAGGRGWIGQGQVGCDYQLGASVLGGNIVIGAFGDYNFSDVSGEKIGPPVTVTFGDLKQDWAWSIGGRVGYLVKPTFLTYFSAGYTETHFEQVNYRFAFSVPIGLPANTALPGATYKGWFLGSGFEYALGFLPGVYLKSEYRFSEFDRRQFNNFSTLTNLPTGTAETVKPYTQSIITSLVYRFNWGGGGPVVARY